MALAVKRWDIRPACPAGYLAHFRAGTDFHDILVQILYNRGVTEPSAAQKFLNGDLVHHDPRELRGMEEAVARIRRALQEREPIVVYGDFDADGVTATALLVETLRGFGARVSPYIPHRVDEGYGLNCDVLEEKIRPWGATLVVTVDCGVRSAHEVRYAASLGMDMIVTDHHDPGQELPPAVAVVNPKQAGCAYPFKGLSGVGLAFKLAQALFQEHKKYSLTPQPVTLQLKDLLDLVALGTVADIVPLQDENRYLVQRGLEVLRKAQRPGIQEMLFEAGLSPERIDATAIGFILGPRLNAAGRLDTAGVAYRLLTARDRESARPSAQRLGELNRQRQKETADLVSRVKQQIEASGVERPLYLVTGRDYKRGVVGLAAGRLAEEYYRPVLVAELGEETATGSARSIPEFNITAALDRCFEADPSLLVRYGGHAMAAGFTAPVHKLPELEERLLDLAAAQLGGQELQPSLLIDAQVALPDLDYALAARLKQLEPCGEKNPQPVLASTGLRVVDKWQVGAEKQHLKLRVCDGANGRILDAIAFRQGDWLSELAAHDGRPVDLAYSLELDQYNGLERVQLMVRDIRWSDAP